MLLFFVFKQKTAYEMRISDWSSDVCSSDLHGRGISQRLVPQRRSRRDRQRGLPERRRSQEGHDQDRRRERRESRSRRSHLHASGGIGSGGVRRAASALDRGGDSGGRAARRPVGNRSEEHTSELQSLMRISYAVFCLKKKNSRAS